MRIAFIYAYGIHPTLGGVANVTYSLSQLFREKGHEVWFIGLSNTKPLPERSPNQVFLPNIIVNSKNNVIFLSDFLVVNRITFIISQTASYDTRTITLLGACKEMLLADNYNIKIITCFHSSILTNAINYAYTKEIELKNKHLGILFNLLKNRLVSSGLVWQYIKKHRGTYKTFLEKSDYIVMLCEGQKTEFLKMIGKEFDDKINVIPNPAPKEEIDTTIEKENIILWIGQFSNNIKRPDWILNIWKRISYDCPEWKLLLLGDGEAFNTIKRRIENEHIDNVELTGRVIPKSYYQRGKILCLTSVHEAFPMVLMEAQQYSVVPVVYNSFTSAPLIIKDNINGLLITPFDEKEFATRLKCLMNNEEEIKRMAESGTESVKCFTRENIYKYWEKLLTQ